MKHLVGVTHKTPVLAVTNHPDLEDSIKGFLEDPVGTIRLHLNKCETTE